jgi:hypothetical protein
MLPFSAVTLTQPALLWGNFLGSVQPAGISRTRIPLDQAAVPAVYSISNVCPALPPTAFAGLMAALPLPPDGVWVSVIVFVGVSVYVAVLVTLMVEVSDSV